MEATHRSQFLGICQTAPLKCFCSHCSISQGFTYGCCFGSIVGLRPSEACNVRREDSPLGAGILFHQSDNQVFKIEIDLRKKCPLEVI